MSQNTTNDPPPQKKKGGLQKTAKKHILHLQGQGI